jgi:hypothetical protein
MILLGLCQQESKAAYTRRGDRIRKEIIRHTCPSGAHGSGESGPKWQAHPCSETAIQKKSPPSIEEVLLRSISGEPEEVSPISE